jgi:hypothetical protein
VGEVECARRCGGSCVNAGGLRDERERVHIAGGSGYAKGGENMGKVTLTRLFRPVERVAELHELRELARASSVPVCPNCGGSYRLVRQWENGELWCCRRCGCHQKLTFGLGVPDAD